MNELFIQLAISALVGIGAGYVGSFMVLRKMSLVGDALSHVALPGIALALIWNINPFLGAFALLFLAVIGIWRIELKTNLPSETLVGIFFTLSLAIGILITPEPELLEALFGDITQVGRMDFIYTLVIVPFILVEMTRIRKGLMLGTISPEITAPMKIPLSTIQLEFLLLVATVVALGLKVTGTLLMGALVIIPAAAAKNISSGLSRYTILSAVFGGLSGFIGILLGNFTGLEPGPLVVIASGIFFTVTLFFRSRY